MSTDEIRIAVAECCGWTAIQNEGWAGGWHANGPDGCNYYELLTGTYGTAIAAVCPNYPASLDACAEMEKALDSIEGGWSLYTEYLEGGICATPLQRCEAFLRVKGKWKEATP